MSHDSAPQPLAGTPRWGPDRQRQLRSAWFGPVVGLVVNLAVVTGPFAFKACDVRVNPWGTLTARPPSRRAQPPQPNPIGPCGRVAAVSRWAAGGYAAQHHAMRGVVVAADTPHRLDGSSPVHVVGVISPGDDVTRPATCTVSAPEGSDTIPVAAREARWGSITAGRRLPGHPTRITCARRVAITSGPAVWTYPAAAWWLLHSYLLLAAGTAAKAIGQARCRRRPPPGAVAAATLPGDEEARA